MDVPIVTVMQGLSGCDSDSEFLEANKKDILATIEFLYKRGMWSKFHYTQWKKMVSNLDAETAHLWWDSIVSGAMFEMESPQHEALEAATEKMEEMAEEKVEMKPMNMMMKKHMSSFGKDKPVGPSMMGEIMVKPKGKMKDKMKMKAKMK